MTTRHLVTLLVPLADERLSEKELHEIDDRARRVGPPHYRLVLIAGMVGPAIAIPWDRDRLPFAVDGEPDATASVDVAGWHRDAD